MHAQLLLSVNRLREFEQFMETSFQVFRTGIATESGVAESMAVADANGELSDAMHGLAMDLLKTAHAVESIRRNIDAAKIRPALN